MIVLLLGFAAAAAQPSFDCARAHRAPERAICANEELAALDREEARLYRLALDASPIRQQALVDRQRRRRAPPRFTSAATPPTGSSIRAPPRSASARASAPAPIRAARGDQDPGFSPSHPAMAASSAVSRSLVSAGAPGSRCRLRA